MWHGRTRRGVGGGFVAKKEEASRYGNLDCQLATSLVAEPHWQTRFEEVGKLFPDPLGPRLPIRLLMPRPSILKFLFWAEYLRASPSGDPYLKKYDMT